MLEKARPETAIQWLLPRQKKEGLGVIEAVFTFTANQEREHAEVFYKHLSQAAETSIAIDGSYPVDISQNVAKLLRFAQHNEFEEHEDVYKAFEEKAREEGFPQIAASFHMIGAVERKLTENVLACCRPSGTEETFCL